VVLYICIIMLTLAQGTTFADLCRELRSLVEDPYYEQVSGERYKEWERSINRVIESHKGERVRWQAIVKDITSDGSVILTCTASPPDAQIHLELRNKDDANRLHKGDIITSEATIVSMNANTMSILYPWSLKDGVIMFHRHSPSSGERQAVMRENQ
jgi:hypothetical protein